MYRRTSGSTARGVLLRHPSYHCATQGSSSGAAANAESTLTSHNSLFFRFFDEHGADFEMSPQSHTLHAGKWELPGFC